MALEGANIPVSPTEGQVEQGGSLAHASKSPCSSPTSDNVASTRDDDDLAVLALRVVGMPYSVVGK